MVEELRELNSQDADRMLTVGVDMRGESPRSGSFVQVDQRKHSARSQQAGLEVMEVGVALAAHAWLKSYWWRALSASQDEFTRATDEVEPSGYFIRALPGAQVEVPVQTCMYLKTPGATQKLHNIVIAEEGSTLTVVTGCATATAGQSGFHLGVTEFYVKRGATLNFTMIHNWGKEVEVRPRSAALVEEGGVFGSNFFCFRPVGLLQMYPAVRLQGAHALDGHERRARRAAWVGSGRWVAHPSAGPRDQRRVHHARHDHRRHDLRPGPSARGSP